MKVKKSCFLEQKKPWLKELLDELLKQYPYASILAVDCESTNYQVGKMTTSMTQSALLANRGFVIKAYDGTAYAEYSFNDLTPEKIPQILQELQESAFDLKGAAGEQQIGEYGMLEDEPCVFSQSTEYETAPEDLGDERILAELTKIKDAGLAVDDRIINCNLNFSYQKYSKLFLPKSGHGAECHVDERWHEHQCQKGAGGQILLSGFFQSGRSGTAGFHDGGSGRCGPQCPGSAGGRADGPWRI